MKKIFNIGLLVIWMCVIFYFSHQPGNESSETSSFVLNLFVSLGIDIDSVFGNFAHILVRKSAHFLEYFILCLLFYNVLRKYEHAFIFTVIYASLDEFHQLFIPLRAGSVYDIIIDSMGALVALGFLLLIRKVRARKLNETNKVILES